MSTMTHSRKSVKFSCEFVSIVIRVNDVRYNVDLLAPGECGTAAWRLCKQSGDHEVYDVIRTHDGIIECTCPDYEMRHRGNGYGLCKHGRSLVALGLLDAPRGLLEPIGPGRVEIVPPCCSAVEPAPCAACVTAPAPAEVLGECDQVEREDAGPAETWGDDWDDHVWNLGPDSDARLDLAGLVDRQVAFYESWANPCGAMLADTMRELALKIRMVDAATPDEYHARIGILDADIRSDWMDAGRMAALEPEMTAAGRPA